MTIQKIEIQLAALEAELRNQRADFRLAICAHTVETMEVALAQTRAIQQTERQNLRRLHGHRTKVSH
jgi:hypothetical protein